MRWTASVVHSSYSLKQFFFSLSRIYMWFRSEALIIMIIILPRWRWRTTTMRKPLKFIMTKQMDRGIERGMWRERMEKKEMTMTFLCCVLPSYTSNIIHRINYLFKLRTQHQNYPHMMEWNDGVMFTLYFFFIHFHFKTSRIWIVWRMLNREEYKYMECGCGCGCGWKEGWK